jgi:hypothetical protein
MTAPVMTVAAKNATATMNGGQLDTAATTLPDRFLRQ